MWIDTHCHLDASEFDGQRDALVQAAAQSGVRDIVMAAVDRGSFERLRKLADHYDNCWYALGIHPLYVPRHTEEDLDTLREQVKVAMQDSRFVALGEIGLDLYAPALKEETMLKKQEHFFIEQLKIAREWGLPVLLHTRRAVDWTLKLLRQYGPQQGIAHAFSGSKEQAQAFIKLGFKISFCGTCTYERAHRLRMLAQTLPLETMVLETDAPDMSPVWLQHQMNRPEALPQIGAIIAQWRGVTEAELAAITRANALAVLPRMNR